MATNSQSNDTINGGIIDATDAIIDANNDSIPTTDANDIVVDQAGSKLSDLWKTEDYWAIWLGLAILILCCIVVFPKIDGFAEQKAQYQAIMLEQETLPFASVEWYQAEEASSQLLGKNIPLAKTLINFLRTPVKWTNNPIDAIFLSKSKAESFNVNLTSSFNAAKYAEEIALSNALMAQNMAATTNYQDSDLNAIAGISVDTWQASKTSLASISKEMAKPFNMIPGLLVLTLALGLVFSIGRVFIGGDVLKFFIAFCVIFLLVILAQILGNQATMTYYGISAEIWSIVIGMLIANTIRTPAWLMHGIQVEYFIKTGLVILGAEVLFNKMMAIGIPGIFLAWIVTPTVLILTYIFGQKVLKIESKSLTMVICADMSVCGTSAAIATASACRAKKEELTLSVGMSLVFTAIMMVVIPIIAKAVGMHPVLAGAWIGGTVDSTGAVAAAGAFLGPQALQVAATIKMIQNVLIGVTAFFVAVYWCAKVEKGCGEQRVSLLEIWYRFPKFVLGFLGVSIIFTLLASSFGDMSAAAIDYGAVSISKGVRGWCFALAFLSIGLATNFRDLAKYFKGGKPIILYICGQTLNLVLTLFMAYLMFFVFFPEITASI